jgi:hypothetical protein
VGLFGISVHPVQWHSDDEDDDRPRALPTSATRKSIPTREKGKPVDR